MRLVAFMALSAIAQTAVPTMVDAQDHPPSIESVTRRISEAVERISKQKNLGIDPRLVDELRNNVLLFTENFCREPPSVECSQRYFDDAKFDQIVDEYLSELFPALPRKIVSIADRFANGSLWQAGWPSEVELEVGAVVLDGFAPSTKSFVKTATGALPISSHATRLILPAGTSTLIVEFGGVLRYADVILEPGATTYLELDGLKEVSDNLGLLYPREDAFCYTDPPRLFEGPLAVFNWGRATFAETPTEKQQYLATFARQPVVEIQAFATGSLECSADCLRDLASLFAQAITVWRSGCLRCDANALVLVSIGPNKWLDARLARRLRASRPNESQALDLAVSYPAEQMVRRSPLWFGTALVVPYVEITNDVSLIGQICKLSPHLATWIGPVQKSICQVDDMPEALRPAIIFSDNGTDCGKIAIACGLRDANVQLNGSFYQFWIPSSLNPDGYLIGQPDTIEGPIEIWPVVLHEVGHWFGVPHAEIVGEGRAHDVMNERYGTGPACVSGQSLTMLNNAADTRWRYRPIGGGSLMPLTKH